MAKAQQTTSQFPNIASIVVTETAGNTLTFKKLETGVGVTEKVAWIISRLEYYITQETFSQFNTNEDVLDLALTASNNLTTIADPTNPAIIDWVRTSRIDAGTAAVAFFNRQPLIRDFTMMAGGGLIVSPNPLYLAAKGTGLNAASTNYVRIYYQTLVLTVDDYWSLVESRRVITS